MMDIIHAVYLLQRAFREAGQPLPELRLASQAQADWLVREVVQISRFPDDKRTAGVPPFLLFGVHVTWPVPE